MNKIIKMLIVSLPLLIGENLSFGQEINSDTQEKAFRLRKEYEKIAKKLLKLAQKRIETGEYWKSTIDLAVILDFYPDYSRQEEVIYLLGNSLYEMDLYRSADEMYRYLLKERPGMDLIAECILGLQKVDFQRGNLPESLKFYAALESHFPEHEVMEESRYYAMQAHFLLENYVVLLNISHYIHRKSEFYPFALYTAGLGHLKKKASEVPWKIFCELPSCHLKMMTAEISLIPLA